MNASGTEREAALDIALNYWYFNIDLFSANPTLISKSIKLGRIERKEVVVTADNYHLLAGWLVARP